MIRILKIIIVVLITAQFTSAQHIPTTQGWVSEHPITNEVTKNDTVATNDFIVTVGPTDTLIDFGNGRTYDFDNNDVIKELGKILYVKINYSDEPHPHLEYFFVNDSLYYCREYYQNGNLKSKGDCKLSHIIVGCDTVSVVDTAGNEYRRYIRFRKLHKTGEWCDYKEDLRFMYQGNYDNDKRVDTWKYLYIGMGEGYLLFSVNYAADSLKRIERINLEDSLTSNDFNTIIKGRWQQGFPFEDSTKIMFFYFCKPYHGGYGDYQPANYLEFLNSNQFDRKVEENGYETTLTNGVWKTSMEGKDKIVSITFNTAKIWKFKLLYFDAKGHLILEKE